MTRGFSSLPSLLFKGPLSRLCAASLCFLCLLQFHPTNSVRAEGVLPRYDLDSLIYLSECIIAGEVREPWSAGKDGAILLQVREVLRAPGSNGKSKSASKQGMEASKGDCRRGKTIAVYGLGDYRGRPESQAFHGHPRDRRRGESVLLFLHKLPEEGVHAPWRPVPSGVRVLWGERYYAFEQFRNPGPYILTAHRASAVKYLEYRKRLKAALKRNRALRKLLSGAARARNDRLFDYLRSRIRRPRAAGPLNINHRDRIAEGICRAVAVRDEPALIARALRLRPDYHCSDVLIRGLITPRGRDFVLQRLSRPNLTPTERRRWSRIAEFLGDDYYSRYVFTASGGTFTDSRRGDNGRFVTRMASLALRRVGNPIISDSLTRVMASFSRGRSKTRAPVRADTARALAILRKLHDKTKSSVRRFYLQEFICRASPSACRNLTGSKRPVLSLVGHVHGGVNTTARPGANFTLDRRLRANELVLEYRLVFFSPPDARTRVSVILASADGRHTHRLPMSAVTPAGDTAAGATRVRLPRNLRAGEYRVYIRVTRNSRAAGPAHPASFVRARDLSLADFPNTGR